MTQYHWEYKLLVLTYMMLHIVCMRFILLPSMRMWSVSVDIHHVFIDWRVEPTVYQCSKHA